MSRPGQTAAITLIACLTVGGLAGCASTAAQKPFAAAAQKSFATAAQKSFATAAQKSFAQIRVIGFTRTGITDDTAPGTSDASGVYVGHLAGNADLINVLTGPGVTVTIFRKPSPYVAILPTDNTVWIGRGDAPLGCGLQIYQYRPGKSPDDWWNVSDSQLAQARSARCAFCRSPWCAARADDPPGLTLSARKPTPCWPTKAAAWPQRINELYSEREPCGVCESLLNSELSPRYSDHLFRPVE